MVCEDTGWLLELFRCMAISSEHSKKTSANPALSSLKQTGLLIKYWNNNNKIINHLCLPSAVYSIVKLSVVLLHGQKKWP